MEVEERWEAIRRESLELQLKSYSYTLTVSLVALKKSRGVLTVEVPASSSLQTVDTWQPARLMG